MIRPAHAHELAMLAAIEERAAQAFAGTPMAWVLGGPPAGPRDPGPATRIWVAAGDDDAPLGFLEAESIAGWLHVAELSVDPAAQRRGLARALLDHVAGVAHAEGFAAVSLTTDAYIAWNAPAYRRMGFRDLAPSETPGWLRALLAREAAAGFDPARRVAMARRP